MAAPLIQGTRGSVNIAGTTATLTVTGALVGEGIVANVRWYSTATLNSATCTGETVEILGTAQTGGPNDGRSIWLVIRNVQSAGNKAIDLTFSASASAGQGEGWRVSGHDTGAGMVGGRNGASGSSAAPSVTMTGCPAECLGFAVCQNNVSDLTSPSAGWSLIAPSFADTFWYDEGLTAADLGATGDKTVSGSMSGSGTWVINAIAIAPVAGSPPQVARPTSDTTAGAWTPTPGAPTTLFDKIDEAAADDGDYISATGNTVGAVALSSLSTPEAGTQTLRVRAQGSPTKRLIARLLEGASTRATITVDPLGALATATAVAAGIVSYAALAVELEVQDATSPPTATVTWGAVGTAASGTTSCTPAYPTGISAATSKIFCLVTGRSSTASTAFTMPAGWTSVAQLEGGTGTWGVDTGTRRVGLFQKDTTVGTETGTVTVSLAGDTNNTLRASIFRVEVPSGFGISVEAGTGADTTNATSFSATSSTSLSFAPNDLLIIGVAQNIDSGTQSAQSITAAGITFGTRSNRASTAVTNGNDHRHIMDSVPVTAGTATVAPTYAYTISASGSGPALFARLRATAPTEAARVTWVEFEVPTAASSGGGGKAPMRARRLPLRRLIQH